jgi:hypothetical protein
MVLIWETVGVLFMVFVGSLLHFTFEWSGRSRIIAVFSAINESVWEHLKLGFWSLVFFSIIEFIFIGSRVNNFVIGKLTGLLAFELFVVVAFYGYTGLLGRHFLFVDILIFVLGCVLCQTISYRILISAALRTEWQVLFSIILLAHTVLEGVFTFRAPNLPLFRDYVTGRSGIPPKYQDR